MSCPWQMPIIDVGEGFVGRRWEPGCAQLEAASNLTLADGDGGRYDIPSCLLLLPSRPPRLPGTWDPLGRAWCGWGQSNKAAGLLEDKLCGESHNHSESP